jgi:hypothetical protein
MNRDVFVTVDMLQRDGLRADVRFAKGSIEVSLAEHRSTFPTTDSQKAADWLAACAVINYPESAVAQLWFMLAQVAGGAIPFGSRQ